MVAITLLIIATHVTGRIGVAIDLRQYGGNQKKTTTDVKSQNNNTIFLERSFMALTRSELKI